MTARTLSLELLLTVPVALAAQAAPPAARICLAPATVEGNAGNPDTAMSAVRETFTSFLTGPSLSVTPLTGTGINNSWQIHVRIIYGDDELLTSPVTAGNLPTELCKSTSGQQFCAVSDLSTIVQQRLL